MEHYETAMKPGGLYEGLLKCKQDGLIGHIAISTHLPGAEIRRIVEKNEFEGVLLGVNILNFLYRWEGVHAAQNAGLGVVAMNPLAGGTIPEYEKQLAFLADTNETPTEAALRFCISCPQITVTLVGFTTKRHIDIACAIAENSKPFSAADIDRLKAHLSENMNSICTGCGYCLGLCPQNIPIPNYMQFYNQKPLFGKTNKQMTDFLNNQHIWGVLADCPAEAADCIQCGECEKACTQHLDIMERLAEIAKWEK